MPLTSNNSLKVRDMQDMITKGFQAFVDQSATLTAQSTYTGYPSPSGTFYSTITGRAPIPDLANDLRASFGIERIVTQTTILLQNEFGPNGEPVYAALNDDRGLIRFVGAWFLTNGSLGQFIQAGSTSDYVEITFYGTGLNLLALPWNDARNFVASIDGGASGATLMPTIATILGGRGYSPNFVINVPMSVSLGLHTVKIQVSSGNPGIYGFEILNANASGLVNVNPGSAYLSGTKVTKSLATSVAYNTGVTGIRGGRVVRYITSAGVVSQAFQAVDAAAAYLASASHTNEEVARVYHWREFGCGRADDFSLGTGAALGARAFTLDDGTTTLVGSNVGIYSEGISVGDALNAFTTLTFVGTGLDIMTGAAIGTPSDTITVYIDGSSVGSLPTSSNTNRQHKVASGLTYGTHTVKLVRSVFSAGVPTLKQFIVYQPKKPTIPATALELADYNVMGNYDSTSVTGTAVADWPQMPYGVLAKFPAREFVYVGAGWSISAVNTNYLCGVPTANSSTSEPLQYVFLGTGFMLNLASSGGGTYDFSVTLNGSLNATGVAKVSASNLGGGSYRSTGTTGAAPCRVEFTGLSLGVYTVVIQKTAGAGGFNFGGLYPITPIHSYKSNLYADLQNTLTVGSNSLMDSRKTCAIKEILPSQKAWAQAIGVTSSPTTTSTSAIPCPELSCTVKTGNGTLEVSYNVCVVHTTAGTNCGFQVYVNGTAVGTIKYVTAPVGNYVFEVSDSMLIPIGAGVHKIDVYWLTGAATVTANDIRRTLKVREV